MADTLLSNVTTSVSADTLISNVTTDVLAELPLKTIDANLILYVLFIIIFAYVLNRLLGFILTHISERMGRYRTTITMLIPLLKLVVYVVALYYILIAVIEPSLTLLLAFSGLFGAAIGFGLKDLFADIIAGIIIIFEKPYQIGDMVSIGEKYGEVKNIGIRSTRLQTPGDEQVSAPNGTIFTQSVTSGNAGDLAMMIIIDLYVHPDSDAEKAMKILKEALVTSKYVIISKKYTHTVLLDDFPFYKRVRAKGYVNDLRFEFEFKSEVSRRALAEFRKVGIRPPSFVPPEVDTGHSGNRRRA
ncbi:MAG: mechanosensitive ion channel [Methanocorpusculum sp.]|uniref:mechanosensitive ion channel family protein n=1 Tax=Methanocorpusculum sp. TaxID=2058474 RepID=UPI00271FA358|nr:mechanosensitive ion channel domain-containing protein [Methanocorpusculum sp.]MDO9523202.1 mechanosensitive ion channel [Methanocorpusculum sp.]